MTPSDQEPAHGQGASAAARETAEHHRSLAERLLARHEVAGAARALLAALAADPTDAASWGMLDGVIGRLPPPANQLPAWLRAPLARAIRDRRIDPGRLPSLGHAALCVLATDAEAQLRTSPELRDLLGLIRAVGVNLERSLRELRAALLDRADDPATFALAAALAAQGLLTDHVLDVSAAESARLAPLRAVGDPIVWSRVALLGCYEPLHRLPGAARLVAEAARVGAPAAARELVRIHIEEPLGEAELAAQIPRLFPIVDEVSRAVRAQYEESPYPRWSTLAEPPGELSLPSLAALPASRILVAGGGTGQHPIAVAKAYPRADVIALDLSLASLGYAASKARKMGIENLRFVHGDLLALDTRALGGDFDAIECLGVLHHLRDPAAGGRILASALRPGGWMKLGLYSAAARRPLTALAARLAGAGAGPDEVRRARRRILDDQTDPLHRHAASWAELYNLSECRDLLFHVQEHLFSVPSVLELVADLGLRLIHFVLPDGMSLADPHAAAALEAQRPQLFASMIQLWTQRA